MMSKNSTAIGEVCNILALGILRHKLKESRRRRMVGTQENVLDCVLEKSVDERKWRIKGKLTCQNRS